MITPKQKAEKLVHEMYSAIGPVYDKELDIESYSMQKEKAKKCALIHINKLVEEKMAFEPYGSRIEWFESVKKEIEKL